MKKYKGFYPSWYIQKKNNEAIKKFKRYLTLILVINLLLCPMIFKKSTNLSLESENKESEERVSVINELSFLFNNNIDDFRIEDKILELRIPKNDFKSKFKDLEKKIKISSVEEVEEMYLIKGEFNGK